MINDKDENPIYLPPAAERLYKLERLADAMDTKWELPIGGIRVGYDSLIGLIPGIGDTITSLISMYIIREAHMLGVPHLVKLRMGWNIFIDWLIGLIPLLGDVLDIGWKANRKNVELVKKHARATPEITLS